MAAVAVFGFCLCARAIVLLLFPSLAHILLLSRCVLLLKTISKMTFLYSATHNKAFCIFHSSITYGQFASQVYLATQKMPLHAHRHTRLLVFFASVIFLFLFVVCFFFSLSFNSFFCCCCCCSSSLFLYFDFSSVFCLLFFDVLFVTTTTSFING